MFNKELLEVVKKILKKVREFQIRNYGWDEMIKGIGPINDWEYWPEIPKDEVLKNIKKKGGS